MRCLLVSLVLLLIGCEAPTPVPPPPPPKEEGAPAPGALLYRCESGTTLELAYLDFETAQVRYAAESRQLGFVADATVRGATYADSTWAWRTLDSDGVLLDAIRGDTLEVCVQDP